MEQLINPPLSLTTVQSFVLSNVLEFLYEQEQILKTTPVIKLGPDQEMHLSFINRSIAEIIRLFFNTDLKQFYETEYTLIKHFNFTHESINNCAPAELMLYYNIINTYKLVCFFTNIM